jgi:hypothetical protein
MTKLWSKFRFPVAAAPRGPALGARIVARCMKGRKARRQPKIAEVCEFSAVGTAHFQWAITSGKRRHVHALSRGV